MLKTQTHFNPLECGLCKEWDCPYRMNYDSIYRAGQKIKIAACKRLQQPKQGANYENR
jgi:hypothetical protein